MKYFAATLSILLVLAASIVPLQASIDPVWSGESMLIEEPVLLLAGNRRKERRDDRQDCRQEEGLAGKDKRDCKHGDDDDDQADDSDDAADADDDADDADDDADDDED